MKTLANGAKEIYYYDEAGQLISVTNGTDTTLREYIYWGNEQIAFVNNGVVHYVHNDHLNTPQVVTNAAQQVVWMGDYEPFGKLTAGQTNSIELYSRFPGQYLDSETGLYYNYFRDYDPSIGRYSESDPIGLNGGINTYGYVNGNPVNFTDRFGLFCNSSNGTTSCSYPGGPSFSVPTPIGYPSTLEGPGIAYHGYDVRRPLNGANSKCVMQQLNDNPTPGRPNPATPEGTANNATVLGMDNHVTSYSVNDSVTGAPLVVNIAGVGDGSLFGPGYVARGTSNGQAFTVGEGLSWKQAPLITGYGFNYLANEALWGGQMNDIINNCTCQN